MYTVKADFHNGYRLVDQNNRVIDYLTPIMCVDMQIKCKADAIAYWLNLGRQCQ